MDFLQPVWDGLTNYLNNLDWFYIPSVIFITYFLAKDKIVKKIANTKIRLTLLSVPTVVRAIIIGFVWMGCLYWIRGYWEETKHGKDHLETFINSLFFAMVFYQVILQRFGLSTNKSKTKDDQGSN